MRGKNQVTVPTSISVFVFAPRAQIYSPIYSQTDNHSKGLNMRLQPLFLGMEAASLLPPSS